MICPIFTMFSITSSKEQFNETYGADGADGTDETDGTHGKDETYVISGVI